MTLGAKAFFQAFAPFLFVRRAFAERSAALLSLVLGAPTINPCGDGTTRQPQLMITGKVLKARGWKEGRTIGLAKKAAHALTEIGQDENTILERLDAVLADPDKWTGDPICFEVASELIARARGDASKWADALRATALPYEVWGKDGIDPAANAQMENALRLPVAVAGALMPDAHVGYGLPIGGVLATQGTVIPYAVGVDIACFVGETRVALADGHNTTLRELAARDEPFVVFCCTAAGRITAARATAHRTRADAELVEVELDNGEKIRCTPDHEWMLRDGSFRAAAELKAGTSLMPFYSKRDDEGYTRVQQPYSEFWQRAHWLIARAGLLGEIPSYDEQRVVIHHKNFDESDNRPENLEFMGDRDHSRYHRELVERNRHWQSPEFEARRVEALGAKAATAEGHAYFAERGSRNLLKYWARDYETARAKCAGNGERGKAHLIARNQSAQGRAKSRELANRIYTCEICGVKVRSPIGLHNHRRAKHRTNHKVVAVRALAERAEVFCLNVPGWENFALAAGVFVHNCRMRLSIYEVSPQIMGQHKARFEKSLVEQTRFGPGAKWGSRERKEHEVLDDDDWRASRLLHSLRGKAIEQLGTSGGGNHFVEWGEFTLDDDAPEWGIKAGKYLSLLSHSGSRGVGFKIANEFSRLARGLHPNLPDMVKHLAWLDLDSDAGREYWIGMELAGRFASACHNVIHHEVAKAAGFKEVAAIENHHNFAWREPMADGSEAIVHRKGATPAGEGVLGIIPGSMADAGYVVRGRGVMASLNSASHGAGRAMSRRAAKDSITAGQVRKYLEVRGVKLLGGGLDEAPMAYKNIEEVIAAQQDLVEVLGKFAPKIVMMAAEPSDT